MSVVTARIETAPRGGGTPARSLTRSSDSSREGLAVDATRLYSSTLAERLWAGVTKRPDGCWEWTGAKNAAGYGIIYSHKVNGTARASLAHRVSWLITHGVMPDLFVCHACDNPPCVNPAHLFLGTNLDNSRDRDSKGRLGGPAKANLDKTHCPQGHPYDGENLRIYSGYRACGICKTEQARSARQRLKDALARGETVNASPTTRAVADIVQELLSRDGHGLQYGQVVSETLGLTPSQAEHHVRRARMAGLLPPPQRAEERVECPNGHRYTPETMARREDGTKRCRICAREATRRYRARRSASNPKGQR